MGKVRKTSSPWDNLKASDISTPEVKTFGLRQSYVSRTHGDLRRDPKFQDESEKLLNYLSEQEGAAEAITGGLISNDIFETLRDEEGRLLTVADRARVLKDAPEDIKQTYAYLRNEFENSKPGSFGEVGKALFDRGVDLFADPINLALALVAPGVGSTATKASAGALNKALTSEAGKQSVKRTLNNISASKVGAATAFEGAAWTGVENANRQDINIATGVQDAFSKGQFGLAVGTGAAFGGALGYGATKLFSRRTPSVAETPPSTTKPTPLVDEASPIEKLDFSNIDTSQPLVINYNRLQNIDGTPTTVTKQTEVIFEPTGKTRANGTPVYATTKTRKGEIQSVVLDDKAIRESFKNKPWTTSRVQGVSPLKADDIQTEDEWVMFNLLHELDHVVNPKPQVMKKALFENRANERALEQLKIARETNVLPEILTNAHQKVKDTVSNFFDGITTSTTRRGQEYFDRNLNPEVDTNLLNKLGKSLNNKYDDTRVGSIILGIKDTIFKRLTPQQKSRGLDIATKSRIMEVNDVNPDVLAKFKEYGLTESEIDIAIREVRNTYLKDGEKTATGVLESGQKVKVSQRLDLTDEDISVLARGLSNNVGGGQRTSDVLADAIAESNATQGISNSAREKTILSRALNQASKFNAKFLTGKVAGVLDPYVRQAPNVIGALQKRVTSSLSNSWNRGEGIVRNTNDYGTVFDREFGRLGQPFKAIYEPVLKLAKGELRDNIDTLLSNAIRTGSTKELGEATSHLDKEVRKSLLDIVTFSRTQLNELGTELQGRGFVNNLVDNYLPRLWKRSEIEADEDNFINLLEKNVSFSGNAREGAKELYDELLDIKYQFGNDSGTGMNSFFAKRALVLKDETAFNKYLDNDLNNVMISYYRSAAKSFAKDDVFNVRNIEEFKSTWFPAIEKEMRENGADSASIQSARNDMLSVYQSITGEDLDRFGAKTQLAADTYMLANRMALLPLSTLSSLTEIFINISKAGPKTAFAGMRDAVFSGSKKMYDDSLNGLEKSFNMTRKEAMEELNYMGIALDQAFADYADRLGGDALASPVMRGVSNKFFRLTLLDQWTRGVQTASYITGKRLIAENLESIASHMPLIQAGKTSRRVQRQIDELADLGINYNEGVEWLQQGAKTGDNFYTKLKEGAGVYTNEVILNPSAQSGIKPMYMSNPKTAILGQLLGYPAAFTNTIMKNVIREGTRNPETILTQHLPAAAIMTGVAAFTNAVRTQGESLEGDPEEVIGNAFLRWGGNGLPADMFVRGRTAAEIYQNPSAYMTGLGPVWGDTYKVITTGDIFSVVGQKVPLYGAFNAVFGSFESTEDFPDQYRDFLRELDKNIIDETIPDQKATPKRNFRKGGEVYNVMQVPIEPDERIDKMTGLAYDIQAGEAFIDEEDRVFKSVGGISKLLSKAGTNIIKGLYHGSPHNVSTLKADKAIDSTSLQLGRGVAVTTDKKAAEAYLSATPNRSVGLSEKALLEERTSRGSSAPTLYELEARINDNEIIKTGTRFIDQLSTVQTKIESIARDFNITLSNEDKNNKRIFYILKRKLEDKNLKPENIFKDYGIKAAKRDLRGTSLEGLSLGGNEEYSFFDDSVLKIINKTTKDDTPRKEFGIGGKVKKVLDKIMYAGSARMGVTQEDLRNHEKEVVTFLNEAIERGEIPKQFKVPTDEAGFGDFRKPFNDEVWNVMNHAYLSYKHGKGAGNKFLLQLKEQIQMPFRPDPRTEATDMVNNAYGFGLQNIAKDDLDAQRIMIKDYDITQEKLKAGKPLMYGVDPLYNPKETKLVRTRSLMDTKYGRTGL